MRRGAQVRLTTEAAFALASMDFDERDEWSARIQRLAVDGVVPGARRIRGTRDLYRLRTRTWSMLYRRRAGTGSIVVAALFRGRPARVVDAVLGGRSRGADDPA